MDAKQHWVMKSGIFLFEHVFRFVYNQQECKIGQFVGYFPSHQISERMNTLIDIPSLQNYKEPQRAPTIFRSIGVISGGPKLDFFGPETDIYNILPAVIM